MATCPNCGYKHSTYSKGKTFIIAVMLIAAGYIAVSKSSYIASYIDIRGGYFIDERDKHKYRTINIGDQVWMAENLNIEVGYSACYGNLDENCEKYGRLYDWITALTACPENWHLPSYGEWQVLIDEVGGKDIASKNLKAEAGWEEGGNGSNTSGFSALPGGLGYSNAVFYSAGTNGNWWSSTEQNASNAYYRNMFYQTKDIYDSDGNKLSLFSVRCVKN
jgi:uncharacterized protein (TIGR02145 family)